MPPPCFPDQENQALATDRTSLRNNYFFNCCGFQKNGILDRLNLLDRLDLLDSLDLLESLDSLDSLDLLDLLYILETYLL